ncbi:MAG: right-handed parallel beta-helix repeat-containing protein [Planctomycetota bacterium]|nr:right-handed parallel beta-helix repeat-containing protein [Planctomycetota bacterium]
MPLICRPVWAGVWVVVLSVAVAGAAGPETAVTGDLYVSPSGNDAWSGRRAAPDAAGADGPFATLERARDELRRAKQRGTLPRAGAVVLVRGGRYAVGRTFTLGAEDSGSAQGPILYRAYPGETPVFSGGVRLSGFAPVADPAVRARLSEASRDKVVQVNLKACGVTNILPPRLGGFGSPAGFKTHPAMELFFDGRALPLARWPNEGWARIADVSEKDGPVIKPHEGIRANGFTYEGDRPSRWTGDKDILLHGYWCWDWADSYERVAAIDPAARRIALTPPCHEYGFRKGQRYYALNLLSELDAPGEWYIDRASGVLYLYPPSEAGKAIVELSVMPAPLVQADGASHVTFRGLTWELGAGDGVIISGGEHCVLAGCTVRRFGGNGVEVRGGTGHNVRSCDIYSMGRGGVGLAGGDRRTLSPGGHVVENCDIHDLSRIDRTYTPAIWVDGVGQRIARNWLHDIPSSAIRLGGNDHLVEGNEACRVVGESDDQGALDMYGNPTFRGNVIRHNYWHHVGNWRGQDAQPGCGQAGVRLDDAISGVQIVGNIFYHCGVGKVGFGAVQIHGGKDNLVHGNLFADCRAAVSFSAWGEKRWGEYLAKLSFWPEVDKGLYLARYGPLARLGDGPDVNEVSGNVVFRCGQFLLRDSKRNTIAGNLVTSENPGFLDASGGLRGPAASASGALAGIRFEPIPVDRIGLYMDEYRPSLPSGAIAQARAGADGPTAK